MLFLHRKRTAVGNQRGRSCLRQECPDLPGTFFQICRMRTEDAECVPVISANYCFHFGGVHGNFDYMGLTELHLHLEGTVTRDTVLLLDPGVSREQVDSIWSFTDFAGF